jgi:hypothetical protein
MRSLLAPTLRVRGDTTYLHKYTGNGAIDFLAEVDCEEDSDTVGFGHEIDGGVRAQTEREVGKSLALVQALEEVVEHAANHCVLELREIAHQSLCTTGNSRAPSVRRGGRCGARAAHEVRYTFGLLVLEFVEVDLESEVVAGERRSDHFAVAFLIEL